MEIALTPDVEQYIQAKASSGQYASASEVFLAGIKLLQDIDQTYQGRYQALRDEVIAHTAAVNPHPVDALNPVPSQLIFLQRREAQVQLLRRPVLIRKCKHDTSRFAHF